MEKRHQTIEGFIKLIASLVKGVDTSSESTHENQHLLDDLEALEKEMYRLLNLIQDYQRKSMQDTDANRPLEIDQAWQKYEQHRSKFRDLSGIASMGGGTGMLNRLRLAFRHKDADKLAQTINTEKENFFTTIPDVAEFQTQLTEHKTKLEGYRANYQEILQINTELEMRYRKCQEEWTRKKDLLTKANALNHQVQDLEHEIDIHQLTMKLFKDTMFSADKRFGPNISRVMSRLLPQFTKQRYQHVQVTEDLKFQAYSVDKSDFIDISELSGGTVDQLFIALRLAFSQAVMAARVGKDCKQFLFFDEPIISFDEERSDSFLDHLSDYNQNFIQVFVVSPHAYKEKLFNFVIHTDLDSDTLIVSGKKSLESNLDSGTSIVSDKESSDSEGKNKQ